MTTRMQGRGVVEPAEAATRRKVLTAGGAAVLALALIALVTVATIARTASEFAVTEQPLSAQVVPLRVAPAGPTDAAATPVAPSDSDLTLQAYAPHGG